jgi:hypothetical protein
MAGQRGAQRPEHYPHPHRDVDDGQHGTVDDREDAARRLREPYPQRLFNCGLDSLPAHQHPISNSK